MMFGEDLAGYLIIYLLIPAIFLYNSKLARVEQKFLSKQNTNNLRGIAITIIAIHHLVLVTQDPGLLTPFKGLGYLGVSVFFFLSGYGLTFSYLNGIDYFRDFFSKRMIKIFLPFILVNILHLMINYIFYGVPYSFIEFISLAVGIKLIDGTMWYINVLLFWYICFYAAFKYFKTETAEKLILLAAVLYFIFCFKINLGKYWFDSSFAFTVGVLLCPRKKYITSLINKYFSLLLLGSTSLFVLLSIINHGRTSFPAISFRAMAAVVFVFLVYLFMYKVDISRNKVLSFLGSISFEIYLIHSRILQLDIITPKTINLLNLVLYFTITVSAAYLLNRFNLFLHKNMKKPYKNHRFLVN